MRLEKRLLSARLPVFQIHVKEPRNFAHRRNPDRKSIRHDISRD